MKRVFDCGSVDHQSQNGGVLLLLEDIYSSQRQSW